MEINIAGIVSLLIFYLIILVVGIFAAWKVKVSGHENGGLEVSLVAGRDLKTIVGIFTMIATTVGGGYINGTAESIAKDGLLWTLAPFGIFIGLSLGGTFYARKMRERQYLTMLDPFQEKYGGVMVVFIYVASLMGDLLWTASILNALGTTLSVIAGINLTVAVIVSGGVSIMYTIIGSMISVAYTDIVQLLFILVGLTVSLPFVLTNDKVGNFSDSRDLWLGKIERKTAGFWADLLVAMTLGTIPWQAYFQRVLSMKSARQAQVLSFVAAVGAIILVIPSILIGIAGTSADWTNTSLGHFPNETEQLSLILPLVIHEFTPTAISICGLGAISAAVMSSVDSSILATSSMFTCNIYHQIFRPRASKRELSFLHMFAVLFFGALAIVIALTSSVIYGTFILAADIVFVIIFPQLTAILYCPQWVNSLGAFAGFMLGLFLRLSAGEPLLEMQALIKYWLYDNSWGQLFPYRTMAVILSFVLMLVVTKISRLKCFRKCNSSQRRTFTMLTKKESFQMGENISDKSKTYAAGDSMAEIDRKAEMDRMQGDSLGIDKGDEMRGNICHGSGNRRRIEDREGLEMGALVNGRYHSLKENATCQI